MPSEPPSVVSPGQPAGFSCQRSPGLPKAVLGRQSVKLCIIAIFYCYFFPPNFWLCRPPYALNGDMARLYVNFKPTDKRFAFLLTSHDSFAR